jgi:hypothetical protein
MRQKQSLSLAATTRAFINANTRSSVLIQSKETMWPTRLEKIKVNTSEWTSIHQLLFS